MFTFQFWPLWICQNISILLKLGYGLLRNLLNSPSKIQYFQPPQISWFQRPLSTPSKPMNQMMFTTALGGNSHFLLTLETKPLKLGWCWLASSKPWMLFKPFYPLCLILKLPIIKDGLQCIMLPKVGNYESLKLYQGPMLISLPGRTRERQLCT